MSTIGDLLFGSGPTPQVSNSTSSTSQPKWLQDWYNQLLTKGSQTANAPYVANPNQQVAPLTANQNQAYSDVAAMQGAQQPLLNSAGSFAQSAGTPFDSAALSQYMSPYTQNVVDTIGSLAGRNLSESLLPQVNDTFTRAGQFGSRGNFDLTGRAIRDSNESALNAQSQALESGYGTALSAYQGDQNRKLSAAGTLGQLATTGQNIGLQGAAALEAAGQSQQQQGQKNLDVLNQQWQQQQDYPKNQVSWLSTLFNPNGAGSSTTTSNTTTPSTNNPSPLSGILGSIGSIGSLIGSLFAEGGPVRMADGGAVDEQMSQPAPGTTTIGSMAPDPASIARGKAEIVRRAQVALAKDPAQRDDRDNHALMAYQMLMRQAAPQVEATWQDADGNTMAGTESEATIQRQNLDRRDARTSPNHRTPVPGAIGYRGGGKPKAFKPPKLASVSAAPSAAPVSLEPSRQRQHRYIGLGRFQNSGLDPQNPGAGGGMPDAFRAGGSIGSLKRAA